MISTLLNDLRLFLTLVFISLLIILFDNLKILDLPKSVIQKVTIPIEYGLFKTSIGVGKQFEFIVLSRTAAQEKKALEEQLASVISENADLRRKLSETQGLVLS